MALDLRLSAKFVLSSQSFEETDSRTRLNDIIRAALGSPKDGTVVEISITAKALPQAWPACKQLGYWGDRPCDTINAPAQLCTATHYHRPAWRETEPDTDGRTQWVCDTCINLGITPSHEHGETDRYNHTNEQKPS